MGGSSSVPSNSELSVAQVLWKTFGAVPVLPFPSGLAVFSVLVKDEAGNFFRIGDLGSLCVGDGQANLQNLIANPGQSITMTEDLGSIDRRVANSRRLSSRLLGFRTAGVTAGFDSVHSWRVCVPSHQRLSADPVTVDRMLRDFILDKTHPYLKGKRKMAVWVVTEVIRAPFVSVFALDGRGANVGAGLSLPNPPVDLEISLRGEGAATASFMIRGAKVNGTFQPLPFAFRGWKYQYQNGNLTKPTPAVFGTDSANGSPLDLDGPPAGAEPNHVRAPTPFNDPHMADFVVEEEWFTTILDR